MFVQEGRVYALFNRSDLTQPPFDYPYPHSILASIDTSAPKSPKLLSQQALPGVLWEGGARQRGKLFYIVSYRRSGSARYHCQSANYTWSQQAFVTVISASPEGTLQKRQEQPLLRANGSSLMSFQGLTITMSDHALLIAEYKEGWERISNCQPNDSQQTTVNVFSFDSLGLLNEHPRFSFEGFLTDQHKQSSVLDPKTKIPYYCDLIQVRKRRGSDLAKRSCAPFQLQVANRLITVSMKDKRKPELLHSLTLGKPKEEIRGSLFDPKRKMLYAITTETNRETAAGAATRLGDGSDRVTRRVVVGCDPFYAIDLSNPAKPVIRSEIDELDGDINFFQLVQNGDFLVSVGRDSTGHCTGFQQNGDVKVQTRVAVSLVDVRDPDKATLIQRKCFGIEGLASTSNAQTNLDQGHKELAFASFQERGLLALPINYQRTGSHVNAIGMMQIDLAPWKTGSQSSLCTNCLNTKQAVLLNTPVIRVRFPPTQRTQNDLPTWVLGMNDKSFSIAHYKDNRSIRNTPLEPPNLRNNGTLFSLSGGTIRWWTDGWNKRHLIAHPHTSDTPVEIPTGQLKDLFVWEDHLLLLHLIPDPVKEEHRSQMKLAIQSAHIDDKGLVVLSSKSHVPSGHTLAQHNDPKNQSSFWQNIRSQRRTMLALSSGIFQTKWIQRKDATSRELGYFDLSDPKSPQFRAIPIPARSTHLALIKEDQAHFYLTYEESISTPLSDGSTQQERRVYVVPFKRKEAKWTQGPRAEIPGALLAIKRMAEKTYFITADYRDTSITDLAPLGYKISPNYQQRPVFLHLHQRISLSEQVSPEKVRYISSIAFEHTDLREVDVVGDKLILKGLRNWYWQRLNRTKLDNTPFVPVTFSYKINTQGFHRED